MARLKARGRKEIFRVVSVKEPAPEAANRGVAETKHYRALMTDGNVLERMVIYYTPEEVRRSYGERSHDYGWKVRGKIKAGLSAEQLLKSYLDRGWEVESLSPEHFRTGPDFIVGISDKPIVTEAKAANRKRASERQREKAATERQLANGPGFYVTNALLHSGHTGRSRVADHPSPFATFEEAEEWAVGRMRYFASMSLNYLHPLLIVEADSRQKAETGYGHVWWQDGKFRGGPVDPRQERLF
jgi:hypothetical protein